MDAPKSTFVWHEMMTPDVEKSKTFYTGLIGWTTGSFDCGEGETYNMIQVGEEPIGGYGPLNPTKGIPSHWMGHIAVASVDESCAKVVKLGGKVQVPPTDIPNVGRFAIVEDPQGGAFSLFASAEPCEDDKTEVKDYSGRFVWNELLTSDPDSAAEFYMALLGWGHKKEDMGGMEYHLFYIGEEMVGGMMKYPQPMPRPYWMPYIAVGDVDASTKKAITMGATQLVPPTDIPKIGRFSVFMDPTGAAFALFKGMEMK